MRHNLNIRVSGKPQSGGVVACRTVMVVVPGNSVESIAITEVPMGGGAHE